MGSSREPKPTIIPPLEPERETVSGERDKRVDERGVSVLVLLIFGLVCLLVGVGVGMQLEKFLECESVDLSTTASSDKVDVAAS